MDKERFQKQIDFILEIDKEKNIFRQTHLSGCSRFENDAEHAWHMAIMVYLLKEYSNAEFDVSKAMMMALIHDIVEIDAGDTYAYSAEDKKTQKEREEKAANRIFGLLPFEQEKELRALFDEFEAGETAEARFVRAMDNLQPLLLNHSNGGADVNVGCHACLVASHGLGGQNKLTAVAFNGLTDQFLTDGIAAGGVNVIDAGCTDSVHQFQRLGSINALDGNAAETHTGNLQTTAAESNVFHGDTSVKVKLLPRLAAA